MSVRCISPWYSLFVYGPEMIKPCCYSHFNLVEKGKQQSLNELWNGHRIREFRKAMLEGITDRFCPPRCPFDGAYTISRLDTEINEQINLPHEINKRNCRESIRSKLTLIESKPIKMQVNLSHACNLRCIMCRIKPFTLPKGTLEECRKYYPYLSDIDFTGGEPLLSSREETLLITSKYPHIKISVVTNATLLDDFWINTIVEHFKLINISINAACRQTHERINAGSNWDSVINNVQKLIALKKEKNSGVTAISPGLIAMLSNVQKLIILKKEKNSGVTAISPGLIVMLSMVVLKSNYLEMKELLNLAYDLGCGVVYVPCEGAIEENVFYGPFKNETIRREVQQIIFEIKELNKIYKLPLCGLDALLDCSKPPPSGEQD